MKPQPIYQPRFQSLAAGSISLVPYVWRLGQGARLDPYSGNLLKNTPLIESLVKHREAVVKPLHQLLSQSMDVFQIAEGLFLAQRLAEENVRNVKSLYPAASRFNTTTNPLIQVYLAGFYRKLNVPDSFGPMMEMLMRQAQQPRPPYYQQGFNPMEEVGGTLLQQIADHTAKEVMNRLGR